MIMDIVVTYMDGEDIRYDDIDLSYELNDNSIIITDSEGIIIIPFNNVRRIEVYNE